METITVFLIFVGLFILSVILWNSIDTITYGVFRWCVMHKWERREEISSEPVIWGNDGQNHGQNVYYRMVCLRCGKETEMGYHED